MLSTLVSVSWLQEHRHLPNLVILDASPQSTMANHSPTNATLQIEGARHFDLKNRFSDQNSGYPNTLPSPEQFEQESQQLGINSDSIIVVYDNLGIYTSPRVWWLFKVMGHHNIAVLNGGLPAWIAQGCTTVSKRDINNNYSIGSFKAQFNPQLVCYYNDIVININKQQSLVIDARSADRFNSLVPEPRKGLRCGHIPNSINIPYTTVLNNGIYKTNEELRSLFNSIITTEQQLIFSCGSGVTACIVLLAYTLILPNKTAIYDGSWTEWAQLNP